MSRKLFVAVATILCCTFLCVSLAAANSTTFKLLVQNLSTDTKTVKKVEGWSGEKKMVAGTQYTFSHNQTAYYNDKKTYTYAITVYEGESQSVYCSAIFKVKNVVTTFGKTKINSCTKPVSSQKCVLVEQIKIDGDVCSAKIKIDK